MRSDLFNAKVFLPSQPDDSLASSKVVTIKGKTYNALPNTPPEFVKPGGAGINQAFIKRMLGRLGGNPASLLPKIRHYRIHRYQLLISRQITIRQQQ